MDVVFASYANIEEDFLDNFLLACSIRDFAGNLSDIPLRIYASSGLDLKSAADKFSDLNVAFSQYAAPRKDIEYAFKSAAAKACETDVKEGNVVWLDRHMMVLNPCVDLLLNPLEQFAWRPPHLKLLGASADEPLNPMWATACGIAGVDLTARFPVYTEVDRKKIRPYFSAGHFSFRAEAGIMREWDDLFNRLADHREMKPYFDDETLAVDGETVGIFLHQIALTLTVLKKLDRDALKPLPAFYGYPTRLHRDMERYYRATQMEQLRTAFYSCRYGLTDMPVSERLASWIEDKAARFRESG